MSNLLPVLLIFAFAIVLIGLVRKGALAQRRADLSTIPWDGNSGDLELGESILRTLRMRNLVAILVAVFGASAAVLIHQSFPHAAGISLAIAPISAWILASLVLLGWRLPHESKSGNGQARAQVSAELTPRTTGMFGPSWGITVPAVLTVASLVGLVLAGLLSSPDEQGRYRQLDYLSHDGATLDENMVVTEVLESHGSIGAFPGWYYGIPVGMLMLIGLLIMLWALRRNASRPSLRSMELRQFDAAVRTHNGYVLSTGFSAMLCLQMVPLLLMAAMCVFGASSDSIYTVGQQVANGTPAERSYDLWLATLAGSMGVLSLVLLAIGVVLLGQLAGWVLASYQVMHRNTATQGGARK